MIGLLCIRGGAVLARLVLHTGSRKAGFHYIAMEVSSAINLFQMICLSSNHIACSSHTTKAFLLCPAPI